MTALSPLKLLLCLRALVAAAFVASHNNNNNKRTLPLRGGDFLEPVALTKAMNDREAPQWQTWLRGQARYLVLSALLSRNRTAYVEVAETLHFDYGVERLAFPNLEDVRASRKVGDVLAPLADVANMTYVETPWEVFLLWFTRQRYQVHSRDAGFAVERSKDRPAIRALLLEMLQFARHSNETAQKDVVLSILRDLMTPLLPPFYRFFVTGTPWQDLATSLVAPFVFGYLVGPATPNRRSDGKLGGLVVHRCKFLQESGCKGLCLHQCKLPAQQLFEEDLGVPLSVKPNFQTLECQWSWGQSPLPPEDDPDWPRGCLVNCPTKDFFLAKKSSSSSSDDDDDDDETDGGAAAGAPFCS